MDSYGEPRCCQSGGVAGDNASGTCDIDGVPGSGHGWISYWGADGGNGWDTYTDGDLDNAYPDAVVNYTSWGTVYSVTAYEQGFGFIWIPNLSSGTTTVRMTIAHPRPAPPTPELRTVVTDIDLTALKGQERPSGQGLRQG